MTTDLSSVRSRRLLARSEQNPTCGGGSYRGCCSGGRKNTLHPTQHMGNLSFLNLCSRQRHDGDKYIEAIRFDPKENS